MLQRATGQPSRLRTSDGEISWDQPGLLFGLDDGDPLEPITDVIGRLVVDAENNLVVERNAGVTDEQPPPTGSIVAVPGGHAAGQPVDIAGNVDNRTKNQLNRNHLRQTQPREES